MRALRHRQADLQFPPLRRWAALSMVQIVPFTSSHHQALPKGRSMTAQDLLILAFLALALGGGMLVWLLFAQWSAVMQDEQVGDEE